MADRWPNFFLVGAMKAGTTAITNQLARHPEVFICPVKEPNYFSSDLDLEEEYAVDYEAAGASGRAGIPPGVHSGVVRDERRYLSLFSGWRDEKIGGDCSTSYLYSAAAAGNIRRISPEAKILIILRNPVDRAYSEFLMNCSIGVAVPPFAHYLDLEREQRRRGGIPPRHKYVTAGLYAGQVKTYLRHFPPEQVLILLHDDMRSDFGAFMQRVWRFLDVRPLACGAGNRSNTAKYPRFARLNLLLKRTGIKRLAQETLPASAKAHFKRLYYGPLPGDLGMTEPDRDRLIEEFSSDVRELSRLLGRELDGWLARG